MKVTPAEIEAAKRAMLLSKAWPVVFTAGSAEVLAIAALEAAASVRMVAEEQAGAK